MVFFYAMQNVWDKCKELYVQKLYVFLLILCIYFLFHNIYYYKCSSCVHHIFESMHNMRFPFLFLFFTLNA